MTTNTPAGAEMALLPCPFCGAAAHFEMDDARWEWVECESCGMQGNRKASIGEDCKPLLREAWNRRASLSPASVGAEGWKSIDSAPKDGTTVIIGRNMGSFSFVRGYGRFEGTPGAFCSGWISHGFCEHLGNLGLAHPTHWMPLPLPPGTAASTPSPAAAVGGGGEAERARIDPMQDPFRPVSFLPYAGDETPAEQVLRQLACWLGVGGFNAPTVDAAVFHRKIVDGINMMLEERAAPSHDASPPNQAGDAERLDWVLDQGEMFEIRQIQDGGADGEWQAFGKSDAEGVGHTRREAIDAARAAQQGAEHGK